MEKEVIRILKRSFKGNKSIVFMIGDDAKSEKRFDYLLKYSYDKAKLFGKVFYDDDLQSCAIVLDSRKKRFSLKSILLDIGLVFNVIGFKRLSSVLKREETINKYHPKGDFIHIWYIGVNPEEQGKGNGSYMLTQIMNHYKGMDFYLETSNSRNIPFYLKHGFVEKEVLKLGSYDLIMMNK
ncbi:MAG: GNAT family N-acetyltransferase [Flavobacteriales bacterium]|jgi:ribosomal protein S18 acetylase RimI-like enzyme